MKTLHELLTEIRDVAMSRGVDLGFDPMTHTNLDDLMKARALLAKPRPALPPTSGPSASSKPPTLVPPPCPAPPSPKAPENAVTTDAPNLRGRDLLIAAYERQGFR